MRLDWKYLGAHDVHTWGTLYATALVRYVLCVCVPGRYRTGTDTGVVFYPRESEFAVGHVDRRARREAGGTRRRYGLAGLRSPVTISHGGGASSRSTSSS